MGSFGENNDMVISRPNPGRNPVRPMSGARSELAMTDTQLLSAFVARRDQAAFEELVRRHGSMVLRTCRRQLKNGSDAEDAFQATFLVLARRAPDVKGELLANWLYGVALRVAMRARSRASRQQTQEKPMEELSRAAAGQEPAAVASEKEVGQLLDEELNQLPTKYRTAVVMCCLEGKTTEQAAQEMGCTRGALVGNLARGRDRLRERLARRGVVLTGAALAAVLTEQVATAAVPVALTASAAQGATLALAGKAATGAAVSAKAGLLADAAIRSFVWAKVKLWTLVFASAAVVTAVPAYILLKPPPTDGLVGHYAFNEGKGTQTSDGSSSKNQGTLLGGVTWGAGPKPGSKALNFDGRTGYVKFDKDVAPWLGGTATVACWIKTTQTGTDSDSNSPAVIGAAYPDDNDVVWGWLDGTGRVGIAAGAGPTVHGRQLSAQSKRPINDGLWHHVAMTRQAATGEVQIYVDGVFQDKAISGIGNKAAPLTGIARFDSKQQQALYYFRGALGDLRIYSRLLTAEEIRQLAQ